MTRKLMLLSVEEQALVRKWRGLCARREYDVAKDVREFVLFQSVGRQEGKAIVQNVGMASGGETWSRDELERMSQRNINDAIRRLAENRGTAAAADEPHGRLSEDEVADLLAKANLT